MAACRPRPESGSDPKREFEKLLRTLCHRHQLWRAFADFCELSALAFSNVVIKDPEREARYLKIIGAYEPDEQKVFPQLLALTTLGLESGSQGVFGGCDFLGEAFMALDLGDHFKGQFFTPMSLCRVMALMQVDASLKEAVEEKGFVTLHEPAAGAGAMALAFAEALREKGFNPQVHMHATLVDKDPTAAHMAFVQCALWHLPATVYVGDSLRMEMRERFNTPAHWLGLWDRKLARGYGIGSKLHEAAERHAA